ncbi:MAG: YajG family lipoprotein [Halorhodospira sp.]
MSIDFQRMAAFLLLALSVLLVGCATSSQTVRLEPELDEAIEAQVESDSAEIALRVVDRRPREIFGYRDAETGVTLSGDRDLAEAAREALVAAFEQQGIEVIDWDRAHEPRLEVEIQAFDYQRSGGFLRRQATLSSRWAVSGTIDNHRYASRVEVRSEARSLFGPSEARDAALVNRALAKSVRRVATHRELLERLEERFAGSSPRLSTQRARVRPCSATGSMRPGELSWEVLGYASEQR